MSTESETLAETPTYNEMSIYANFIHTSMMAKYGSLWGTELVRLKIVSKYSFDSEQSCCHNSIAQRVD